MELWIRSQDKNQLIRCSNLYVDRDDTYDFYCVYDYSKETPTMLGSFETEERALQVLDEIQNLLLQSNRVFVNKRINDFDLEKLKPILNGINVVVADKDTKIETININTIVYQMPEE